MQLSLNIQVTLSLVLGILLVYNSGGAIAEIPEKSQTDSLLLNTDELKPDDSKEPGNSEEPDPNLAGHSEKPDDPDKPKRPRRPTYPSEDIPEY